MRPSRFARGVSNPFGKIGRPIGQLRLAERTEDGLREIAAVAKMPPLEFVRRLVELRVHGRQQVEREISLKLDLVDRGNLSATNAKGSE